MREGGGPYRVREELCVLLMRLAKAVERTKAALSLEELSGGVLARLCAGKELVSPAKCVRERVYGGETRVFDRDARMVFVTSEFIGEAFVLA